MKFLPAIPALALVLGVAAAPAAPLVSLEGWQRMGSPDFTLYSQLSAADTAAWAGRLAQFLTAMKTHVRADPRILGPFTVVVFSRHGDFLNSAPVLASGDPIVDLGAFSRSSDWGAIAAACEEGSTEDTQSVMFQAGVNWILSGDARHRPQSLGTGLAEVYSSYLIEDDREIFGRRIAGWAQLLRRGAMHPLDSDGRFLKIEDLLSVGDFEPVADRHGVPMYFAESWGFAHFLLFSKEMAKEHAMDRLLDAFSRHLSPRVALQTVFGPAAASLDTRFYDYIKGGNFYEVRLPVEPAPPLAAPTAAAPADIAATLAELEASVKNSDAGRAYAEQAVRLAPEEPRSHESLALVDFMTEHHLAAAAECREAIRLNTRDAWTWFEAAQEVGRIGDGPLGGPLRLDPDEARESINDCERAVLACKGLTDAYRRLARLIPAASHVTQDDGKFLVLGRALFPDDGWIEIGHAQWARRNRRNDLAVKILDDVIARADALTPAEVAAARSLRTLWTTGPG